MKMRNILAAVLVLCMALSLMACGNTEPQETTQATTEATKPVDDGKVAYKVTVVDNAGNPMEGVWVQICLMADEGSCLPGTTDANGVKEFLTNEAEYKVSFINPPEGYTVEEAYYFEAGSHEMTITLNPAA